MRPMTKAMITALALGMLLGINPSAQAQTSLRVMVFAGLTNFSIFAAQHKGLFAKHGLAVELLNTPSSDVMRDGLAKGDIQIAHAGVDNAVAMAELAKVDVAIVTGGDNGFNRIIAQPEIKAYADLRGKTVVVDAPNTAFALLLYKVLKDNGLNKGDYVVKPVGGSPARLEALLKDKTNSAGVLNPPFIFNAAQAGMRDLGLAAKAIGAYQSDGACDAGMANANGDTLVRSSGLCGGPPLGGRSRQQGGSDPIARGSAQALARGGGTELRDRRRSGRRHCQGCEIRHGRLPERAEAAGRDRRPMGRHPAPAREIS